MTISATLSRPVSLPTLMPGLQLAVGLAVFIALAIPLLLAAQAYEERHGGLPPGRRIDVIAIDLDVDGELVSVEHIESAIEEG